MSLAHRNMMEFVTVLWRRMKAFVEWQAAGDQVRKMGTHQKYRLAALRGIPQSISY